MNPYLAFALRVVGFLGLVGGFIALAIHNPLPGRATARLIAMFGTGAVLAFFVEGPTWGTLEPVSARPLVVVLGILLMAGASWFLWSAQSATP
jgi:hypothetical protein